MKTVEKHLTNWLQERKRGIGPLLMRTATTALSWGYGMTVTVRNWAYDKKFFKLYTPPVPVVISIGNLVAGGTGKTPLTIMLAKQFSEQLQVAVLSRGYRSAVEHLPEPIILSKGEGPLYPATYCGDEPFLIASQVPKACVYVGKYRSKAALMAAKGGAQMLLLDDGMQHRALNRDFEIVAIDAKDPWGSGKFLPRGLLRDTFRSLKRASLICLTHADQQTDVAPILTKIRQYTDAPIVSTIPKANIPISLSGVRVGLFAGIAKPSRFITLMESEGADIVAKKISPDHLLPPHDELASFAEECKEKGATYLVCTEKDSVKLPPSYEFPLPVLPIPMEPEIMEGKEHLDTFYQTLRNRLGIFHTTEESK